MRKKHAMEHTALVVLHLLSREDMYGYQMIAALESKFDSTFAMKEGTLYPILKGLENQGAVTSYQQETPGGRARKYYHLTDKGRRELAEETEHWRAYEKAINAVLSMG